MTHPPEVIAQARQLLADAYKERGWPVMSERVLRGEGNGSLDSAPLAAVIEAMNTPCVELLNALIPFAELAGDVKMNEPLSKWLRVAHFWEAAGVLKKYEALLQQEHELS